MADEVVIVVTKKHTIQTNKQRLVETFPCVACRRCCAGFSWSERKQKATRMRWTRACLGMHPAVRELYKRYIFAGKDYPAGLDVVRRRVKVGLCCSRQKKTQKEKKTKGAMIGQLHLLFFLSLLLALTQHTHTHTTRVLSLSCSCTRTRALAYTLSIPGWLQAEFMKNKDLKEEEDIIRAVAQGRWYFNHEFIPSIQFRKYRDMKKRYYPDPPQ